MWTVVASRLHTPIKIFPFGSGSSEVMLYGTVAYTLKDERKANVGIPGQVKKSIINEAIG